MIRLRLLPAYCVVWLGVLALSLATYRQGLILGGTSEWAGTLHPVMFGLTAWPVLRGFLRGERWLTIPNAVLGLTYVSIGLGSVYFVFQYGNLSYPALRRPHVVREALAMSLLGVVAYRLAAERIPVRIRSPRLPEAPAWSGRMRTALFAALALSFVIKVRFAMTGALGYVTSQGPVASGLGSLLAYISLAGPLALAGAYWYWFRGAALSRGDRGFVVASTLALMAVGLLSGMKQEFLKVILYILIPFLWVRGDRAGRVSWWRRAGVAGLLGVVVLVLFGLNPLYRQALWQLQGQQNRLEQGVAAARAIAGGVAARGDDYSVVVAGAESLWGRMSIFPYQLAVVDQVPASRPFRKFDRWPALPLTALIPRLFWPDKPLQQAGADFQREFISSRIRNSTTPGVFGWAYMEAGVAGVVTLMLLLGMFARLIETWLPPQRSSLAAVLIYTALFTAFASIEADPFWQLGGVAKVLAVAVGAYLLFAVSAGVSRGRRGDGAISPSLPAGDPGAMR